MEKIKKLILSIRATGLENTMRIARYTLFKQRLDRAYLESLDHKTLLPRSPGKLLKGRQAPSGCCFEFERANLEVVFLAPDLVRLSWEPGALPAPYALARQDWPPAPVSVQETEQGWALRTTEISLEVSPDGALWFLNGAGEVLRSEQPPLFRGEGWQHAAHLAPEEHIYGLGEQAARLDLRPGEYRIWNTDPGGSYGPGAQPLYMPLPVYAALHKAGSYLIFYENSFPATFSFTREEATASFEAGMLRYYLAPGPLPRALERFTELTGRPGLPPLWSLGYHQSRWGYKTAEDVRQVAAGFESHRLPLSAIHLDIDYMDGYRVFTVDRDRFPDLSGLAAELEERGIRVVAIVDPALKRDEGFSLYREGLEKGLFCRLPDGKPLVGLVWPQWSLFPDFTLQETRQWWGAQYARLLEAGVTGIWHDMNEPTSFTGFGDMSLPLATRHCLEGQGGDHRQAHNLYGLQMNRAGYDALRQLRPERRPWILSRSGWVSLQRYAWNWTADTESTWAGLRMTVPSILGLGLSGISYSGPDIGGFSGNPSAELYLRSFQMAAFLPFFRTHSSLGTAPREPWRFGEPYTGIVRCFLELRYRLLPYLYTLAWEASQTGHPLTRPLFWADERNPGLWSVDDAFLLGDDLLVAPVMTENARSRDVLLPPGEWLDFWTGARFPGLTRVTVAAPLDQIPLLVQAGTVLPLQAGSRLELRCFPPARDQAPACSVLYSDAGDGYGPSRLDRFHAAWAGSRLCLDWQSEGAWPFPYTGVDLVLADSSARRVIVEGAAFPAEGRALALPPFRHLELEFE